MDKLNVNILATTEHSYLYSW